MCLGNPFSDPDYFKQHPAPSKRAEELKNALTCILFAHLVLAIVKMILGGLNAGFNDLFSCYFLWIAFLRYDHCQAICYMLYSMQECLSIAVSLGFWAQRKFFNKERDVGSRMVASKGRSATDDNNAYAFIEQWSLKFGEAVAQMNFTLIISILFFTFYVVAIYYSLQGYREFKTCL